jgi:response regulator RpfG family c-di-GMP phosphodiesterase
MNEPKQNRLLLIVEDPMIGGILQDQLQGLSYPVSLHATPAGALADLQQQSFSAVIIDDKLTGTEALKVAQDLAKSKPTVPRLVLTSGKGMEALVTARQSGLILRYITKPWLRDELAMAVENTVAFHHLNADVENLRARNLILNQQLSEGGQRGEGGGAAPGPGTDEAAGGGAAANLTIDLGIRALSTFHPNLGNAALRAMAICRTIGEILEIPAAEMPNLIRAAAFHDVGMLSVDRGVVRRWLRDPAKCTDEELVAVRRHPVLSEAVLKDLPGFNAAAEIVRHHHEAVDGSGYPDGLKGETIPYFSRLLAPVVHFCQRNASVNQILNEIEGMSDKVFDPAAVQALAKAIPITQMPRGEREMLLIELKAGMTLGRDLFNAGGHLLLPKGRELKDSDINRIISINRVTPLEPFVLVFC